jgi:hypothetical protein
LNQGKKVLNGTYQKKAWANLSPEERKKTDDKKKRKSRTGAQFVPNTERARKARRAVELSSRRKQSNV